MNLTININAMSKETFEQYIYIPDDKLRKLKEINHPFLTKGILAASLKFDPRDRYNFLRTYFIGLYHSHLDDDELLLLVQAMFEIDTKCGIEEYLEPGQSLKETTRILALLDADLIIFRTIYKKHITLLKDTKYTAIFTEFAKLIFKFNAYQGPPRLDKHKAYLDSIGESDLFTELVILG